MKKIVIITANPNNRSLTHQGADIVEKVATDAGFVIKRFESFDFPLFGKKRTNKQEALVDSATQELTNAKYICIFTPMWNFGLPGALKNFFDVTIAPRKHFKYTKIGTTKGFLKAKKVYIFYTSGTHRWVSITVPFAQVLVWNIKLIFYMCGVTHFKVMHLGGVIPKKIKQQKIDNWFKSLSNVKFG